MTLAAFQAPEFHDEDKAREALEALRWPDGPICPHCGNSDQERIAKVEGERIQFKYDDGDDEWTSIRLFRVPPKKPAPTA